jgi:hypothetical protein
MKKNSAKTPRTDAMLALRLDSDGIAQLLGLSAARIRQLRREGALKPDGDGLYSVVDALRSHYLYDSPRGDAMRARTRHTNARALEMEQRVRREQRRMLTLDELREIAVLIFESARDVTQAESSRFYHEYAATHDEMESRVMTHRLYDPLDRIVMSWSNGVIELIREIDEDHLPAAARLDEVLAMLVNEITASNRADQKRLTPT